MNNEQNDDLKKIIQILSQLPTKKDLDEFKNLFINQTVSVDENSILDQVEKSLNDL